MSKYKREVWYGFQNVRDGTSLDFVWKWMNPQLRK